MNTPKAKYHIGDVVNVKVVEAGCPPEERAVVIGINYNPRLVLLDYTVMTDDGMISDGYNEEWLSPHSSNTKPRGDHERG